MTAGHRRHRGTLRTRLLNNPQLLFDRVPHPRPSPPAQRISRYDLFSENAHRTPKWTPTMCPLSPSWVLHAPPAMRPKPDGYVRVPLSPSIKTETYALKTPLFLSALCRFVPPFFARAAATLLIAAPARS